MHCQARPKRATALLLEGLESGTPAQAASNNAYPIRIFDKVICGRGLLGSWFMVILIAAMCGSSVLMCSVHCRISERDAMPTSITYH